MRHCRVGSIRFHYLCIQWQRRRGKWVRLNCVHVPPKFVELTFNPSLSFWRLRCRSEDNIDVFVMLYIYTTIVFSDAWEWLEESESGASFRFVVKSEYKKNVINELIESVWICIKAKGTGRIRTRAFGLWRLCIQSPRQRSNQCTPNTCIGLNEIDREKRMKTKTDRVNFV